MIPPTATGAAGQIMRSNAFTLTGNTQNTQIASMTGTSCLTDWLSIPCAMNLGRMPSAPLLCVDRLCGGTFNSETQNLNESSVISEYLFIIFLNFCGAYFITKSNCKQTFDYIYKKNIYNIIAYLTNLHLNYILYIRVFSTASQVP